MRTADCRSAAIILSGGKGLRLGSDIPKQYIELRGKPILAYTIEAFERSDVDEIIIVAAPAYIDTCKGIATSVGSCKVTAVISGGAERYDSVLNGLRYLSGQKADAACRTAPSSESVHASGTASDPELLQTETGRKIPDIVLIHDGARPFIRPTVINEIISCVAAGTAAIAAAPCTDTIKIADEAGCIVSTTDRARTWAAQTPQAFSTEEIYRAYEEIIGRGATGDAGGVDGSDTSAGNSPAFSGAARSLTGITDDAMVYQMAFPDRKVRLIPAGHDNFKITTADDLVRAESLLAARAEESLS